MNVKFGIRQISATPVQIRQISATPFIRINVLMIFALFGQTVAAFCLYEGKKLQHEVKKLQQSLLQIFALFGQAVADVFALFGQVLHFFPFKI